MIQLLVPSHLRLDLELGSFRLPFFLLLVERIQLSLLSRPKNLVKNTSCDAPHYAVFFSHLTFSLLGLNILLSTLLSKTMNLCLSFKAKDQMTNLIKG
jgi:hypothetical protein